MQRTNKSGERERGEREREREREGEGEGEGEGGRMSERAKNRKMNEGSRLCGRRRRPLLTQSYPFGIGHSLVDFGA